VRGVATSLILLLFSKVVVLVYWFVGIDYSMTSPAMVAYETTDDILRWYYMSTEKSKLKSDSNLFSAHIPVTKTTQEDIASGSFEGSYERFNLISDWFMKTIDVLKPKYVFLEGFSLGSQGKLFSIAENTAIMKNKLYDGGYYVSVFPPTVIKKFATGKGNASKQRMKEQFLRSHSIANKKMLIEKRVIDLHKVAHYRASPFTDLIDAYYVLKHGMDSVNDTRAMTGAEVLSDPSFLPV
jgi:Holliday junction resolvasome RuvABC endonuclease subunit